MKELTKYKKSVHFTPLHITKRYVIDNLILRAFHNIPIIQKKGPDAYKEAVSAVFDLKLIRDMVTDWHITFDESIWLPTDENSLRNIIDFRFKIVGYNLFFGLKIDLRNEIEDYIR